MEEKSKPYATIYIRKPRIPRLLSAALILLIAGVVGLFGWRQYDRWQAKLQETERQLQERTASLHEAEDRLGAAQGQLQEAERKVNDKEVRMKGIESSLLETENHLQETQATLRTTTAQLEEAESMLESYLPVWQLREPVGYSVASSGTMSHRPEVSVIFCALHVIKAQGDAYDNKGSLYHLIVDEHMIWDVIQRDDYALVGQDKESAEWPSDWSSNDHYMHKYVFDASPHRWSSAKDWVDNHWDWLDHLRDYCENTYNL